MAFNRICFSASAENDLVPVWKDYVNHYRKENFSTSRMWVFCTDKGAEASARCYSIIETAKLNNLDIFAYLTYLLTELPKLGETPTTAQLDSFLPWSPTLPEYCK
ncbi:MAG: transposase domain-containing protein [Clostridiales bacterium]|nr:transposase domain-containing protein [Clostridiales bacterium]